VVIAGELIELDRHVWDRTRHRLDGLDDAEWAWEPAPGCWSVRRNPDGTWAVDGGDAPDPPPLTTLSWRLVHLADCYGSDRNPQWLRIETPPLEVTVPTGAADALRLLEESHDRWSTVLAGLDDEALAQPLGRRAGFLARSTRMAFVLHQLDEVIHHGAELGVLRDLHQAQRGRE
jgi:DinB superfamily